MTGRPPGAGHQHRHQPSGHHSGVLGEQRESEPHSAEDRVAAGAPAHQAPQRVEREHGEARDADIGGHQSRVSEHVGAERVEEQHEQRGAVAPHLSRPEEEDRSEQDAHRDHRQPRVAEDPSHRLEVLGQEQPAETPLFRFGPTRDVLDRAQIEEQERRPRQRLHQRRVLRVEPEIAGAHVGVARAEVRHLVPGHGAAAGAADRESGEHREQENRGQRAHSREGSGFLPARRIVTRRCGRPEAWVVERACERGRASELRKKRLARQPV